MISIPYELKDEAKSLSFLTGGNLVRLARWLPDQNRYAIFDIVGSPQDPEAALDTADAGVARPPIGVGFWSRIVSQTQFQVLGRQERSGFYEIPVKPGFNQVGNPYNFRVPWKLVSVRFGNEVMSIDEAVRRNLIRDALWRYTDGRYTFSALPGGELVEWESLWVRALANLTLIVPRIPANATDTTFSRPVRQGSAGAGWKSTLTASAAGATIGQVTLGAASGARDGYDRQDVENPPAVVASAGEVRVAHRDWGADSGRYAQDIRARSGKAQRWTVEVETSKAGTPVKLVWDKFPAATRGYLQIDGSRQTYKLTSSGAAEFRAPRSGLTRVTVVALAATGS
jgi:hypothetical protein